MNYLKIYQVFLELLTHCKNSTLQSHPRLIERIYLLFIILEREEGLVKQ